jgi:Fe-S-cluster containining protein
MVDAAVEGTLKPGLTVESGPGGMVLVIDRAGPMRHEVPAPLIEAVRAAFAAGTPPEGSAARWLEARHLLVSERVARVDAWGQARTPAPPAGGALPVLVLPGSRFTCHGCGACCESYTPAPITRVERERILERAADLAAVVETPVEGWFKPHSEPGLDGDETWQLGKIETGACVFLGKDKLCNIHKAIGPERKPLVCRRFPLQVTHRPDATLLTLRVECETFSRSRDDGQPLEEQTAWIEAIAREERGLVLPPLVRLAEDLYLPYALGRAIEKRALGLMRGAPTVEQAHLAIRDVVMGIALSLAARPEPEDLDRAEALAQGPLEQLRAIKPPSQPRTALEALRLLLDLLLEAVPEWNEVRASEKPYALRAAANDRFMVDVLAGLQAYLGGRLGWPLSPVVKPEMAEEGRAAAAVRASSDDPKVVDFVRDCFVQYIGSSKPLVAAPGLVYGYAHLALTQLFARFGARLLAFRAGRSAATPADWNHSLAVVDRSIRLLNIAGAAPYVIGLYADLFATEDLPS